MKALMILFVFLLSACGTDDSKKAETVKGEATGTEVCFDPSLKVAIYTAGLSDAPMNKKFESKELATVCRDWSKACKCSVVEPKKTTFRKLSETEFQALPKDKRILLCRKTSSAKTTMYAWEPMPDSSQADAVYEKVLENMERGHPALKDFSDPKFECAGAENIFQ